MSKQQEQKAISQNEVRSVSTGGLGTFTCGVGGEVSLGTHRTFTCSKIGPGNKCNDLWSCKNKVANNLR